MGPFIVFGPPSQKCKSPRGVTKEQKKNYVPKPQPIARNTLEEESEGKTSWLPIGYIFWTNTQKFAFDS
jgi:hypothetical protein